MTIFKEFNGFLGVRIDSDTTSNASFIPLAAIGAVVFDPTETSATVYLNFQIPGQGNNTIPAAFEVSGADAAELLEFVKDTNYLQITGSDAT